jgi:hypothetical protein
VPRGFTHRRQPFTTHRELLTHVYILNLPLFSPQASATTGAALRVGAGAVDHLNTVVTDMSAHAREQNTK